MQRLPCGLEEICSQMNAQSRRSPSLGTRWCLRFSGARTCPSPRCLAALHSQTRPASLGLGERRERGIERTRKSSALSARQALLVRGVQIIPELVTGRWGSRPWTPSRSQISTPGPAWAKSQEWIEGVAAARYRQPPPARSKPPF